MIPFTDDIRPSAILCIGGPADGRRVDNPIGTIPAGSIRVDGEHYKMVELCWNGDWQGQGATDTSEKQLFYVHDAWLHRPMMETLMMGYRLSASDGNA